MPKIIFRNLNRTVEVDKGVSILETAIKHNLPLHHTCGGNCSCSTCHILVLNGAENLSKMETNEAEVLDSFDLKAPHRLGCQSLIVGAGTLEVDIPDREKAPRPNKTPPLPE